MGINSAILGVLCAIWLLPVVGQRTAPREPVAGDRAAASLDDAEKLIQAQRFAEAEQELQIFAATQTKNPQFWFDLGFAQAHQENTAAAISSYQKAVQLAPSWFEANLNLGLVLAQSGNSTSAVPVLRHALELKPLTGGKQALSKAWEALADVLAPGDPRGAADAYDKAADLNPEKTDALLKAGRMLQKAGDFAAAEQHFRSAAM
ncbi:MAG: tetratricopeptide repeat protein, partial [Candidatus Angelobacter sp.]